ncbi:hypothetical protein JRO89_XS11G0169300 [Xanthoceras sorbifolium]|uniref:Iron-binding zinc finger CDGSH type domain-containing protein n=1 Tax=Xanthoceras sorbifolium TaxID=99658 RepID=A0ABQ8HFW1_9ROSI|nr:hypothetical protein JRO89_XS11G0169300 [Xanthoceras sorbifolium]
MASIVSTMAAGFCYNKSPMVVDGGGAVVAARPPRRVAAVVVRAEAGQAGINPDIRKTEAKVVDSVVVTELSKPLTAYCRCWRSGTFPLCDGTHAKHNKATGDNVGPLLLKKQ